MIILECGTEAKWVQEIPHIRASQFLDLHGLNPGLAQVEDDDAQVRGIFGKPRPGQLGIGLVGVELPVDDAERIEDLIADPTDMQMRVAASHVRIESAAATAALRQVAAA